MQAEGAANAKTLEVGRSLVRSKDKKGALGWSRWGRGEWPERSQKERRWDQVLQDGFLGFLPIAIGRQDGAQ